MKTLSKLVLMSTVILSLTGKIYFLEETIRYFTSVSGFDNSVITFIVIVVVLVEILIVLIFSYKYEGSLLLYIFVFTFFVIMLGINISFIYMGLTNCGCFGAGIHLSPALSVCKCLIMVGCLIVMKPTPKASASSGIQKR